MATIREISREWLIECYTNQEMSCKACGQLLSPPTDAMTIWRHLQRFDIPVRSKDTHKQGAKNHRFGKNLSPETKEKIVRANTGRKRTAESIEKQRANISGAKNHRFGKPRTHGKTLYLNLPDGSTVRMRSRWEAVFADWLTQNNTDWVYEPCTFILSDGSAYTPDFVTGDCYYEVKGFCTPEDDRKISLFSSTYTELKLVVVDKAYLSSLGLPCGDDCLRYLTHLSVGQKSLKNCEHCHEPFIPVKKQAKYCSLSCAALCNNSKEAIFISCEVCGKQFRIPPSRQGKKRTCGKECGNILGAKTRSGQGHWTAQKTANGST